MLTGWVCLYLFTVYVLTHGGKIQGWHSVVWILATFLGTSLIVASKLWSESCDPEVEGNNAGGGKSEVDKKSGYWCSQRLRSLISRLPRALAQSTFLTIVGVILPIFFSWVMNPFTDFSWDGMTSRGITVRNLMKGDPALNAYPFGHVLAGFLAHITGSWQGGKGINLTLIWICFCFVLPTLHALSFSGWRLWFLSVVTTLNPVAVYQISCFQIDGHVASLITCLLFSMLKLLALGPIRLDGVVALVVAFIALAASKTSGVFYAIIMDGIFLLFLAGVSRRWKSVLLLFVVAISVSWPLGVYIRSIGQYAPLSMDYLKTVTGTGSGHGYSGGASEMAAMQNMDRIQQFASSTFSQTEISATELHLKFPFELGRRELRVFEELTPDPRGGGFGPWYGTAILFAGLGCLLLVLNGQATYWPGWFLFLATAASSIGSQVWWARWTPQNWLLLIAMLMTALAVGHKGSRVGGMMSGGMRLLGGFACLTTGINVFLVTLYYLVGMERQEKILNRQIELAANLKKPVLIHIPVIKDGHNIGKSFLASEFWFVDRGIQVEKISSVPPKPRMKINKTETRFPLPPNWRLGLKSPEDELLFRNRGLIED
jgi:hypothetical protein